MNDLKSELSGIFNKLKGMEERARKLKNQNLADIIASAKGRVQQLRDHPDTELIADRKDPPPDGKVYTAPETKEEAIDRMRKDGDADPEGTAEMNWPHLFSPKPSRYEPFNPGDPRFNQANPNFRNPDDVRLNPDGTMQLRQAPNSIGAKPDVREGGTPPYTPPPGIPAGPGPHG